MQEIVKRLDPQVKVGSTQISGSHNVWHVPMTEQMRQQLLTRGQARFARQGQATQYARAQGMKRLIDWFFRNSMGLKRHEAPQVPADKRDAFLEQLKKSGVKVEHTKMDPALLKPSQSEWNEEALKKSHKSENPVLVSGNNYVIDGHHRWVDSRLRKKPVNVIRVNMPARQLIAAALEFGRKNGIKPKEA